MIILAYLEGYKMAVFVLTVIVLVSCHVNAQPEARKLINDLFASYAAQDGVRPVHNASETLRVSFGLALVEILNLDTESGLLHARVWERYMWKDSFLEWNPSDYSGLDIVRVSPDHIWKPDLKLYNSARAKPIRDDTTLALITFDGTVLWIPPGEVKVTCHDWHSDHSDVAWHCPLKFGSWTFDGFQIDPVFYDNLEDIDTNDFLTNPRWTIANSSATKNVKYYPCCQEPYPDLTYDLFISEKES